MLLSLSDCLDGSCSSQRLTTLKKFLHVNLITLFDEYKKGIVNGDDDAIHSPVSPTLMELLPPLAALTSPETSCVSGHS